MEPPKFYSASGIIDPELFVQEEAKDRINFIYQGEDVVLVKVEMPDGREISNLVGQTLLRGAAVGFMRSALGAGAGPGVVKGEGLVMRDGRVVRDVHTDVTHAHDAAYELKYRAVTLDRLRALVGAGTDALIIERFLRSRSYGTASAREELLAAVARASDS